MKYRGNKCMTCGGKTKKQKGGPTPIVTSNKNDPRLKAYNDSLNAYNSTQYLLNHPLTGNYTPDKEWLNQSSTNITHDDKRVSVKTDPNTGYVNVYKKPVQPVIYKKPEIRPSYSDSLTAYNKTQSFLKKQNEWYTKDADEAYYFEQAMNKKGIKPVTRTAGELDIPIYKKPIGTPEPALVRPTMSPLPVNNHEVGFTAPTANYRGIDMTPKQTDYSITYRTDNGGQDTKYLPDYETWKKLSEETLANDGVGARPSYQENAAKTYGRSSGYKRMQAGGFMAAQGATGMYDTILSKEEEERQYLASLQPAINGQYNWNSFQTNPSITRPGATTESTPSNTAPNAMGATDNPVPSQRRTNRINPYFALRGFTTGASWLSGILERGRQNKYMYDQFSTMGQNNPIPTSNFQPNPFSLYARFGGSMKKGGGFKLNPEHEGWCTPLTKSTCTGKRRQFALTMKKHHGFHKK